jgi:hypothetical protein
MALVGFLRVIVNLAKQEIITFLFSFLQVCLKYFRKWHREANNKNDTQKEIGKATFLQEVKRTILYVLPDLNFFTQLFALGYSSYDASNKSISLFQNLKIFVSSFQVTQQMFGKYLTLVFYFMEGFKYIAYTIFRGWEGNGGFFSISLLSQFLLFRLLFGVLYILIILYGTFLTIDIPLRELLAWYYKNDPTYVAPYSLANFWPKYYYKLYEYVTYEIYKFVKSLKSKPKYDTPSNSSAISSATSAASTPSASTPAASTPAASTPAALNSTASTSNQDAFPTFQTGSRNIADGGQSTNLREQVASVSRARDISPTRFVTQANQSMSSEEEVDNQLMALSKFFLSNNSNDYGIKNGWGSVRAMTLDAFRKKIKKYYNFLTNADIDRVKYNINTATATGTNPLTENPLTEEENRKAKNILNTKRSPSRSKRNDPAQGGQKKTRKARRGNKRGRKISQRRKRIRVTRRKMLRRFYKRHTRRHYQ